MSVQSRVKLVNKRGVHGPGRNLWVKTGPRS